jgi:hypothetical protein
MIATAVVGGMCLLSVRQLTVAARLGRRCVALLRAIYLQMAAPASQAAGRLLTVDPDVAKFLTVETLCKDVVGFVSPYLDGNVAEAGKFKDFRIFCGPWKGHKEQWQGDIGGTLLGPSNG